MGRPMRPGLIGCSWSGLGRSRIRFLLGPASLLGLGLWGRLRSNRLRSWFCFSHGLCDLASDVVRAVGAFDLCQVGRDFDGCAADSTGNGSCPCHDPIRKGGSRGCPPIPLAFRSSGLVNKGCEAEAGIELDAAELAFEFSHEMCPLLGGSWLREGLPPPYLYCALLKGMGSTPFTNQYLGRAAMLKTAAPISPPMAKRDVVGLPNRAAPRPTETARAIQYLRVGIMSWPIPMWG